MFPSVVTRFVMTGSTAPIPVDSAPASLGSIGTSECIKKCRGENELASCAAGPISCVMTGAIWLNASFTGVSRGASASKVPCRIGRRFSKTEPSFSPIPFAKSGNDAGSIARRAVLILPAIAVKRVATASGSTPVASRMRDLTASMTAAMRVGSSEMRFAPSMILPATRSPTPDSSAWMRGPRNSASLSAYGLIAEVRASMPFVISKNTVLMWGKIGDVAT